VSHGRYLPLLRSGTADELDWVRDRAVDLDLGFRRGRSGETRADAAADRVDAVAERPEWKAKRQLRGFLSESCDVKWWEWKAYATPGLP
jgi:hypothetical protein